LILLLEDNDLDAELMMHQLAEALPSVPVRRASDRRSYVHALDSADIRLVVSDFSLPDIDGWEALSLAMDKAPAAPLIFVSGVIGEELAVKALKAGATDYVVKQRLERLGAAARRALSEAEDRRERWRAEEALRDSEARFRTLADSAPALIWEADATGAVTFVNRHYEVMFGGSRDDMLGRGWHRIVYEADLPALRETFENAIRTHEGMLAEIRVVDAHGRLRWLDCRAVPRFDRDGRFLGLTGTNLDVTDTKHALDELERMIQNRTAELVSTNERLLQEMRQRADAEAARQQAEEQLRQAQKMEAFGQLTGGVAHDFNNFLTVILGNLETLERLLCGRPGLQDAARVEMALGHAKQGAQRAAALTQRLLAFARRQPLQPCHVDINALIAATAEILARTLGERVDVRTDLQSDVWPAHIDAHMLESALLNLAVNARDAMPDGGVILIQTRNTVLDGCSPHAPDATPGEYVRISISDTGTGIPEDILEKVFEPFFTTKDIGVGTGLGLSQVYGFVKQSGGAVGIESAVGRGTTVHIHLPRHADAHGRAAENTQDGALPMALPGEAILVVEDDDAVRAHTAAVLSDLGYIVLQAGDGASAMEHLLARDDIVLLFTDVGLPKGLNGPGLAEAARAARPGLRVLYTSGYAEGRLTHEGKLPPGVALISKPFTFDSLARKVREVLDQAAQRPADAEESAAEAKATAQPARAGAAAPRVLIVEDDELVRSLTTDALMEDGYDVVEAGCAEEAIAAMRNSAGGIAAAVVDLGLPDMQGDELVRRLALLHPGLPFIIASGYGAIDLGKDVPRETRVKFVQKPYQLEHLYAALKELGVAQ
jgi:PAS domain S-box-containing protein